MRINSVPDVKCFCNNKNVLFAQSMVWHFVGHPVYLYYKVVLEYIIIYIPLNTENTKGMPQLKISSQTFRLFSY